MSRAKYKTVLQIWSDIASRCLQRIHVSQTFASSTSEVNQLPIFVVPLIDTVVPYYNKFFPANQSVMVPDIIRPKTTCSWQQNSAAFKSQRTFIHASLCVHLPRYLCASALPLRLLGG
jgi:hypothetical protein